MVPPRGLYGTHIVHLQTGTHIVHFQTEPYYLKDLHVYQIWCQSNRNYDLKRVYTQTYIHTHTHTHTQTHTQTHTHIHTHIHTENFSSRGFGGEI